MDFNLSSSQKALRDEIIRFARSEKFNEDVVERDRQQEFSLELWRKCGAMGLTGLPVDEEHGGSGLDPLTTAIALEAFGYGCRDSGIVFSLIAHLVSAVVPIWKYGTEAQKQRFLPRLCDGGFVGVHAMTEPDSGSDAFAMRTRAVRDGDGWRINGSKTFISNAPIADVVIAFAVTDPAKGYHGGVTGFLLDNSTPGFRVGRKLEKMGLRTAPLGELVFDEVYVGEDAVLGGVGAGSQIFTTSMDWERVCLFAAHVGTTERLLETSLAYARTRSQFGQKIGKFQAVSHKIVDMKINLEAARLLVYKAASLLEKSRTVSMDAAIAKVFVSESLLRAALDTVQVHGGYGYMTEYEVERALRDAVGSTIYSGTSEIQRNIIARWLGL
jgi:alkylation response protein AidB-like acyl-CoA dehydrogenase